MSTLTDRRRRRRRQKIAYAGLASSLQFSDKFRAIRGCTSASRGCTSSAACRMSRMLGSRESVLGAHVHNRGELLDVLVWIDVFSSACSMRYQSSTLMDNCCVIMHDSSGSAAAQRTRD